jgi:hypothetical protein
MTETLLRNKINEIISRHATFASNRLSSKKQCMKNILIFLGLFLIASSCKKEVDSPAAAAIVPIDSSKTFPYYVNSDSMHAYFIQATFNGKKICFSPAGAVDTFSNAYYFYPAIQQDQLNLIRSNGEGSAEMQIYIGVSTMLTRPLPYTVPHSNLVQCEFTQFQFYDSWHRHGTENDRYDDYTYQASTNTGMRLTVTSFKNNIIEGTFEGVLRTNTGKVMNVQDGSFRIKIYIFSGLGKT